MCVHTRESAFSWCLKKSSMMHDERIGSLLDAVSLSLNYRINCNVCISVCLSFEAPLSIPFVARVKFTSTRLSRTNSSKTSTCCSNVRITLLLHMALKRNVWTVNSSKYATDEIIETMFIPAHPPEVSAGRPRRKCVVPFETECSRGARISSRLSTILSLPNTSTMLRHITIECVAFQENNQMHLYSRNKLD